MIRKRNEKITPFIIISKNNRFRNEFNQEVLYYKTISH